MVTAYISKLKIAIVYDWFDKWGGVERVLLTLHKMFPKADFFSSYFDPQKASWACQFDIKTSFIQKLPKLIRESRIVSLPLYPFAFEAFDFSGYNLVVSVSSSFAKGVITKPKTVHICYLLTPTRFLWHQEKDYLSAGNQRILSPYIKYLKDWDQVSAQRPDYIISLSKTVADRCRRYYQRESEVIYPPFNEDKWSNIKNTNKISNITKNKYFLVVSRLEPYKKVDLVIDVFSRLKDKYLIVVGKGSEEKKLKKIAGVNIQFLKDLTDEQLGYLYINCQALIMPQEEDFGLVALEGQFFGCPVIAYKKGGVTEIVIDDRTGIFFDSQTEKSLSDALERFNKISYNLRASTLALGKKNVERFNRRIFEDKFKTFLILKIKDQNAK